MPQADKSKATVQRSRFREYRNPSTQETERRVEVDATGENGVIYDVLVLGNDNRGMGTYSQRVKEAAVAKFDGQPTYVNHTKDGSHPSYLNKLGVHRNPRMSPQGVRTDFHFNAKHAAASQLIWDAKNAPTTLGFSQDADCSWHAGPGGKRIVDSIDKVYAVDLVSRAGTTNGLWEDEEIVDAELAPLADHAFSAMDTARAIISSEGTPEEKRSRLIETVGQWKGELLEGEIGDRIKADETEDRPRKIAYQTDNLIDAVLFGYNDKYPTIAAKKARILEILADWEKELNALAAPVSVSTLTEEEHSMEFKELTVEQLTKERPDLVAILTKTDERSRLTEEATALKAANEQKDRELAELRQKEAGRLKESEITAELTAAKFPVTDKLVCSDRFMEQVRQAPDKAARAEIIKDRMALASSRMQESATPGPFDDLNPAKAETPNTDSPHAKFFK